LWWVCWFWDFWFILSLKPKYSWFTGFLVYSKAIRLCIHSQLYITYIHMFFFRFFSIICYSKLLNVIPWAIQWILIVYFIHSGVYVLIPNSGSWWWTGRPGVLRSVGSQRVGHDWATELNWTDMILVIDLSPPLNYSPSGWGKTPFLSCLPSLPELLEFSHFVSSGERHPRTSPPACCTPAIRTHWLLPPACQMGCLDHR